MSSTVLPPQQRKRNGFTLPEMMISITILVMIAGTVGMLAVSIEQASEHCRGQALVAQHARIVMSRLEGNVRTAWASETFPGCAVFATTVGTYSYPDTLVIWKPTSTATNPTGLPLVSELVVYTPDSTNPRKLLEIKWPSSSATAPALSNTASWTTLLTNFRTASGPVRTELTSLMRIASTNTSPSSNTGSRAALRFKLILAPTETQWTSYRATTTAWSAIDWPLDAYGRKTGTRTVACQTELQLNPPMGSVSESTGAGVVPFYGSATLNYILNK